MKRLLLFATGLAAALNTNAQYARHTFSDAAATPVVKKTPMPSVENAFVPKTLSAARTTATCFYTETFASGSGTGMPTGWSTGSYVPSAGPSWRWCGAAMGGSFPIGTLASPTASDGWMGYNSDSIGDIGGGTGIKPSGWLQSPAINCTGHTTVRLSFYERFRRFQDTMSVWVGTDPAFTAGTYAVYPVTVNNNTPVNSSLPNPTKVGINVTGVAAGATVYLRFVYYCYQNGGGYNWLIDDVCMSELDPDDVGIGHSFMYEPDAGWDYDGSIFNTPLKFVDSVYPVALLSNYGYNSPATTSCTAQIFRSSTSVYSVTTTYASLPLNAVDSVVQWFPPYLPDAIGDYTCAINASITATDAEMFNNIDTVRFSVTDTTWMQNLGTITGGYYLYRPAASGNPAIAFMMGTRFDVPTGATADTVSGFGVAFQSSSVPTGAAGKVSVQLYRHALGATGWEYVGTSIAKSLAASDISTSSATVWTDFRSDPLNSGGDLILQPGFNYAAMLQINGVTTNLLVSTTSQPNATGYCGYFGQSDSSTNTGAAEFAPTTNATGVGNVPLIRMYVGKPPVVNAIPVLEANGAIVGKGFPNPANNSFTIPVTTVENAAVAVSLTNMLGQELKSQTVNTVGGQASKVTFSTADLANGVYFYNVKVNGKSVTGRIVVSH